MVPSTWQGLNTFAKNELANTFAGGAVAKICLPMQEMQKIRVLCLGQEDPLEEEKATHTSILGMYRGDWQATVREVAKSQT